MSNRKSSRTRVGWAATTLLVAPALLGVFHPVAASAAPATGSTSSVASTASTTIRLTSAPVTGSVSTGPTTPASPAAGESRGIASLFFKAFSAAVKRIPGLWNSFSSAVKKAYSFFKDHGWPIIKNVAAAISAVLDALNIWNGFH